MNNHLPYQPLTLEELNAKIEAEMELLQGTKIKNVIFYSILLIMVILAFFYSGNKNPGKKFGPLAYNTVLTTSMNSVYPKGSLIASWTIKSGESLKAGLENGTDIVFLKDKKGTLVVHRIIEIMEDYEDSGQRAFRTQGVNNPAPDPWVTYEGNVVGRVIWHIPYAGNVLAQISKNIILVVVVIAAVSIIITLLKFAVKKEIAE